MKKPKFKKRQPLLVAFAMSHRVWSPQPCAHSMFSTCKSPFLLSHHHTDTCASISTCTQITSNSSRSSLRDTTIPNSLKRVIFDIDGTIVSKRRILTSTKMTAGQQFLESARQTLLTLQLALDGKVRLREYPSWIEDKESGRSKKIRIKTNEANLHYE